MSRVDENLQSLRSPITRASIASTRMIQQSLDRHGSRPEIGFSDAESLGWNFKLDRRLSLWGEAASKSANRDFFPRCRGQRPYIFSADLRPTRKQRVGSVTVGSAGKYLRILTSTLRGRRLKNRDLNLYMSHGEAFISGPGLHFWVKFSWEFLFSYTFKPTPLVLQSLFFYHWVMAEK